jgi:hypothetical protein
LGEKSKLQSCPLYLQQLDPTTEKEINLITLQKHKQNLASSILRPTKKKKKKGADSKEGVDKKTTFALEINIPELVRTWLILLFPLKLSTTADLYKKRERDLGLTSAGLIMALEVQR